MEVIPEQGFAAVFSTDRDFIYSCAYESFRMESDGYSRKAYHSCVGIYSKMGSEGNSHKRCHSH